MYILYDNSFVKQTSRPFETTAICTCPQPQRVAMQICKLQSPNKSAVELLHCSPRQNRKFPIEEAQKKTLESGGFLKMATHRIVGRGLADIGIVKSSTWSRKESERKIQKNELVMDSPSEDGKFVCFGEGSFVFPTDNQLGCLKIILIE